MNQVLGSSIKVSTQRQYSRTSKETELRENIVLHKVSLNEGGKRLDLILSNHSSSWLFFSRTRERSHKSNSLDLETRVSFFTHRVRVSPIASYL